MDGVRRYIRIPDSKSVPNNFYDVGPMEKVESELALYLRSPPVGSMDDRMAVPASKRASSPGRPLSQLGVGTDGSMEQEQSHVVKDGSEVGDVRDCCLSGVNIYIYIYSSVFHQATSLFQLSIKYVQAARKCKVSKVQRTFPPSSEALKSTFICNTYGLHRPYSVQWPCGPTYLTSPFPL